MRNKFKVVAIIILFLLYTIICNSAVIAQNEDSGGANTIFEFASSPNPVGSGARALGMGGAFIAFADDATAASWNPACLNILTMPQFSLVYDFAYQVESNDFGTNPEANGDESVSIDNINYFSFTYPFPFLNRHSVISINYQHLYNFNREWDLSFDNRGTDPFGFNVVGHDIVDYDQSGYLSAIGFAFSTVPFKSIPFFAVGITLNFWDEDLNNDWEERLHMRTHEQVTFPDGFSDTFEYEYLRKDKYWFSGFNANLGLMWEKYDLGGDKARLKLGMVFKLPFEADIQHKRFEDGNLIFDRDETLDMPMSYGIGVSYRFPGDMSKLRVSADIYRTEWDDFILTDEQGNQTSLITDKPPEESDVDPTYQVRFGAEYRFENGKWIFPLRGGLFYDPSPAEGSPDDYYGASLGFGIVNRDRFASEKTAWIFDIAYQYRFGNDVGTTIAPDYDLKQDVDEHKVYASFIFYLPNLY